MLGSSGKTLFLPKPFVLVDRPITIGVSLGAAYYPESGSKREDLLRLAEAAMYEAKRQGGGRYVFSAGGHADQG